VIGVLGRNGGYTKQVAYARVVGGPDSQPRHTDAFQAVVWHGMVAHPKLILNEMKWEATR
jgi:D-sedoheptulose 7-phosphate isomerase